MKFYYIYFQTYGTETELTINEITKGQMSKIKLSILHPFVEILQY